MRFMKKKWKPAYSWERRIGKDGKSMIENGVNPSRNGKKAQPHGSDRPIRRSGSRCKDRHLVAKKRRFLGGGGEKDCESKGDKSKVMQTGQKKKNLALVRRETRARGKQLLQMISTAASGGGGRYKETEKKEAGGSKKKRQS